MTKEMAYPPGMELHGSGWRVTKRVPTELLPHYAPKKFLRYQTGESDKKAAAAVALRWLSDLEVEFQRIRETGSKYRQEITLEETSYLVSLMVQSVLSDDEQTRDEGLYADDAEYSDALGRLDDIDRETREALSRRIYSGSLPLAVEDWLTHHGYDIKPGSETFKRLCLEFAKGRALALKARRDRFDGVWVDTC